MLLAKCGLLLGDVSATITDFIALEALEVGGMRGLAVGGHRAMVAMLRIKAIVYMAVEGGGTVEPRASTDEDTAVEPFRTVVTVGSAVVGSVIVIPVRAAGFRTDVDAYGDLGTRDGRDAEKGDSNSRSKNVFQTTHKSPHWN